MEFSLPAFKIPPRVPFFAEMPLNVGIATSLPSLILATTPPEIKGLNKCMCKNHAKENYFKYNYRLFKFYGME